MRIFWLISSGVLSFDGCQSTVMAKAGRCCCSLQLTEEDLWWRNRVRVPQSLEEGVVQCSKALFRSSTKSEECLKEQISLYLLYLGRSKWSLLLQCCPLDVFGASGWSDISCSKILIHSPGSTCWQSVAAVLRAGDAKMCQSAYVLSSL